MNWYLVKIVYQIICGNSSVAQFDEQLRLISASGKEEAFYKAKEIGKKEEEVFYNTKQEKVQWKFINVCELYKLGEMIDGAELYSRIEEKADANTYIETVNSKATGIIHSDSHQILQLA